MTARLLEVLDEADMEPAVRTIKDRGIEAVAVSFLHSYINSSNETAARIPARARAAGLLYLHLFGSASRGSRIRTHQHDGRQCLSRPCAGTLSVATLERGWSSSGIAARS